MGKSKGLGKRECPLDVTIGGSSEPLSSCGGRRASRKEEGTHSPPHNSQQIMLVYNYKQERLLMKK